MVSYKIRILQTAQDDLKAILTHIRMDDPEAAVRMVEKIRAVIGNLKRFPFIASIPRDKKIAGQGYRMLVVEAYLVFYFLIQEEHTIEIHRVLYSKQDYLNTT